MTKQAWNKGISVGQKKPLSESQIQFLQEYLTNQGKIRDLALFSFQIDTMLRSSDVIKIKVKDVIDFQGKIKSQINIQQKKTTKPHVVALSNKTSQILINFITKENKKDDDWLFTSYSNNNQIGHISYSAHWMKIKEWCRILGIDPKDYATHTGRRTRPIMVYKDTKDPKLCMHLLGQRNLASVTDYLGIDKQEAMDIYKEKFLK